jgi:O-antigen/teichoic acid export membrane protein
MKRLAFAFLATSFMQIAGFASGILLARLLAPAMRGEVAQIIAWFSFVASIMLLGVNDSITYYRSRDQREGKQAISAALVLVAPLASLSVILCGAVIMLVFQGMSAASLSAAWLFLAFPPLYQLQQVQNAYFQSGHKAKAWAAIRIIPSAVYVSGLAAAIWLGLADPLLVMAANLAGLALIIPISAGIFRLSDDRLAWPSRAMLGRVFRFGLPTVVQRIASACRDVLDRMALPFFVTSAALGHYVVASSTAYLIYVAGITVDLVGFPAMARAANDDARRRMAELLISVTFCVLIALVIVLALISKPVVLFLFGREYESAAGLVPLFLVAGAAQALRIVIGGAFKAFNLGSVMARFELMSAVIMVAMLFGTGARLGVHAGVLAHLFSALTALAMALHAAIVVLKLSPRHIFLPRRTELARALASLLASFRASRN